MVEVARRIPFKELKALRGQFGFGKAGKSAFRLIARGVRCEGYQIPGNTCNKKAQITIDVDIPRVNALEQIPSCAGCQVPIELRLEKDFIRENSSPSFGMNGRGRS